jgi:hypothetical protein
MYLPELMEFGDPFKSRETTDDDNLWDEEDIIENIFLDALEASNVCLSIRSISSSVN